MSSQYIRGIILVGIAFVCTNRLALADELSVIDVTIKHHQFTPAEIHVGVGKPVILNIKNEDDVPEEFDSPALKIEKVIGAGLAGKVRLRPLGAGRYPFSGEFHPDTAKGRCYLGVICPVLSPPDHLLQCPLKLISNSYCE